MNHRSREGEAKKQKWSLRQDNEVVGFPTIDTLDPYINDEACGPIPGTDAKLEITDTINLDMGVDSDLNARRVPASESVFIHVLRLINQGVDKSYQKVVQKVVKKFKGKHKGTAPKGDSRMRNKLKSDHKGEKMPRPAHNIDTNRNCCTFENPDDLIVSALLCFFLHDM